MTIAQRALRGEPLANIGIIDSHAHLGCYDSNHISARGPRQMVEAMDALGVQRCAISSFLAIGPDVKTGNDQVAEAIRSFPGRFIGYAVVNPRNEASVLPELRRCFDELGMTAIKLHPAFHRFAISSPKCEPVFEFANERGCVVLSHDFGGLEFMQRTARRYQRMTLIQAHIAHDGFTNDLSEFLRMVRDVENVYGDIVFSVVPFGTVEKVVEIAGSESILYGSDSPMFAMSYQIGKTLLSSIDDSDKINILSNNARRIFGL